MLHGTSDGFLQAVHRLDAVAVAFQHASPAEITDEVVGGDTVKACHPVLEPAVIGIDVLDMESALTDSAPRFGMHHLMGDATALRKGGVDGGPVRT